MIGHCSPSYNNLMDALTKIGALYDPLTIVLSSQLVVSPNVYPFTPLGDAVTNQVFSKLKYLLYSLSCLLFLAPLVVMFILQGAQYSTCLITPLIWRDATSFCRN